jgi:rhodanese-related sulfurtransferase
MNDFKINEICPTTTFNKLNDGILLVDVREKDEVKNLSFDVPNVINIPMSEFESRFNEIPKDKDIILVCTVGQRSLLATGFLIKNGYDVSKVTNMKLGLVRWVERGFPTKGDISNIEVKKSSCCG